VFLAANARKWPVAGVDAIRVGGRIPGFGSGALDERLLRFGCALPEHLVAELF